MNSLNKKIVGQLIMFEDELYRCRSGLGCYPNSMATTIFAVRIRDGHEVRLSGNWDLKIPTGEEVMAYMVKHFKLIET